MVKKQKKQNAIVVADMGWAESIPDWLKEEILVEREIEAVGRMLGMDVRKGKASLPELVALLFTASLTAPLSHDAAQVYFYASTKVMEQRGVTMDEKMQVHTLDDQQMALMDRMLRDIYQKRGPGSTPLTDAMEEVFGKRRAKA